MFLGRDRFLGDPEWKLVARFYDFPLASLSKYGSRDDRFRARRFLASLIFIILHVHILILPPRSERADSPGKLSNRCNVLVTLGPSK